MHARTHGQYTYYVAVRLSLGKNECGASKGYVHARLSGPFSAGMPRGGACLACLKNVLAILIRLLGCMLVEQPLQDSVDGIPVVAHVTWARLQSTVEWPGGRVNEALQILESARRHPTGFKAIRKMGACCLAACRSAETD